ncbi:LysR family transcriptional regulator [Gallaecimonas pentaromativorans]|uniref:LysR family transcriptional regulator n=1 Tax=Gallaecimonas pentaromativorans TaxID=584787 RepID=A0A3N1P725_9GAMM|nr:LysR family transcriptional regulator [Gallaecimonas pentaromativorans]MED5524866.1 LysR family transcriptional regulator [Pseudomonadota bacterium]ROQ24313.1 LysR family transcriptional regulator [Gallaecimonas pentaromativorans]
MDLNEIQVFTKVVEVGSFTSAGERLNMTKATVSRKIADLEERLGVRLLNRTTRQLNLTETGQAFYERCSRIMTDLGDAQALVTTRAEQVRGKLKIVMPIELGQMLMGRFLGHFMRRYPDVEIDAELTNRRIDMVQEGVDVNIQVGLGQDSNLIARRLSSTRKILVASPEYLAGNSPLLHPEDLGDHENILLKMSGDAYEPLRFSKGKEQVTVQPKGRMHCNNVTFAREALLSGLGVGSLPLFMALPYVNEGRLVRVLPDWTMESGEMYALYQSRQYMPKLLKTFLDELSETMAEMDKLKTSACLDREEILDQMMASSRKLSENGLVEKVLAKIDSKARDAVA